MRTGGTFASQGTVREATLGVGGEVDVKRMGSEGASWLEDRGEVVVKWLGAGVETAGVGSSDGEDVAEVAGEDGSTTRKGAVDVPRLLTIKAAVGTEDRKGDVIDPAGWELSGYRRNPVFLWAHDRSRPPIGQAKRVWVENGALQAVIEFAPTDFAREVADLYVRGFMRGVSVGFLPLEVEMREASHGRRGYLYRRQELLEISAVPVPMHTLALASDMPMLHARKSSDEAEMNELRDEFANLWESAQWLVE